MFWITLIALFLISFFWAFSSLKQEQTRPREIKKVKKELLKEKILYQAE